ncbi:MAG: sensor histidine kinase [Ramlibacter sp.]
MTGTRNDAARTPAEVQDAQLRSVRDTSTVWLWEQDEEFRFTSDLRGRDQMPDDGSIIGRRRWEIAGNMPLRGTWDDHRRCLEARLPFRDFEFRVGRGTGVRYISTTGVPVYAPDGRFTGYRGTAMDVTDLKNAQEDAQKAQSLLKLAARLGRVGAWTIEVPGNLVEWSGDFLWLEGFGSDALATIDRALALIRRRHRAAVRQALTACAQAGTPFDMEVRVVAAPRTAMWMRLIGEAVHAPDGTIKRIQGAAQDITASKNDRERLRRMGEQLAAANADLAHRVRARTRELEMVNTELRGFAHALAHDLKAPISAVQGFSGALENALAANEMARAAHFTGRIKSAGVRMEEYVDALLSLAQTTQADLNLMQVDLSATAANVLDELQGREEQRRLVRTIQPGLVARGDYRLLRMLLENLLGNAWKFTSRCPVAHIAFTARLDEAGRTVFSVQDNGAGFDMAWAGKLFGSFQRLHARNEYAGTGIGLANAQRIVTRHGGRIWADSRVGEGATFSFTIGEDPARV